MQNGDFINFSLNRPNSIWDKLALSLNPDPSAAFPRISQPQNSSAAALKSFFTKPNPNYQISQQDIDSFLVARNSRAAWKAQDWQEHINPCQDACLPFISAKTDQFTSLNFKNLKESGSFETKKRVIDKTFIKRIFKYKPDSQKEIKFTFNKSFEISLESFIEAKDLDSPDLKLVKGKANGHSFFGFTLDKKTKYSSFRLPLLGIISNTKGERFFVKFGIKGTSDYKSEINSLFKIPNDFSSSQDIKVYSLNHNDASYFSQDANLKSFFNVYKELDRVSEIPQSYIKALEIMHKKASELLNTEANYSLFSSPELLQAERGRAATILDKLDDKHIEEVAEEFFPDNVQAAKDLVKRKIPRTRLNKLYCGQDGKTKVIGLFDDYSSFNKLAPDLVIIRAERGLDFAAKFVRNAENKRVVSEILPIKDIDSLKDSPVIFDDSRDDDRFHPSHIDKASLLALSIGACAYENYLDEHKLDDFRPISREIKNLPKPRKKAQTKLKLKSRIMPHIWTRGDFTDDTLMMAHAQYFARRFSKLEQDFELFSQIKVASHNKDLYKASCVIGETVLSCYGFINKNRKPTGTAIIEVENSDFAHKRFLVNFEKGSNKLNPQLLSVGILDDQNNVFEYYLKSSGDDLDINQAELIIDSINANSGLKKRRVIYRYADWNADYSLKQEANRIIAFANNFLSKTKINAKKITTIKDDAASPLYETTSAKNSSKLKLYSALNYAGYPLGAAIIEDSGLKNQYLVANFVESNNSTRTELSSIMIYTKNNRKAPKEFLVQEKTSEAQAINFTDLRKTMTALKSFRTRANRIMLNAFRPLKRYEPLKENYDNRYENLKFIDTKEFEHASYPGNHTMWLNNSRAWAKHLSEPVSLTRKLIDQVRDLKDKTKSDDGKTRVIATLKHEAGHYYLSQGPTKVNLNKSDLGLNLSVFPGDKYFKTGDVKLVESEIDGYKSISLVLSRTDRKGSLHLIPYINKITGQGKDFLTTAAFKNDFPHYDPKVEIDVSTVALLHQKKLFRTEIKGHEIEFMRLGLQEKAPLGEAIKLLAKILSKAEAHLKEVPDRTEMIRKAARNFLNLDRKNINKLEDEAFPYNSGTATQELFALMATTSDESKEALETINAFCKNKKYELRTGIVNGNKCFGFFKKTVNKKIRPVLVTLIEEDKSTNFFKFDLSQGKIKYEAMTKTESPNYELNDNDACFINGSYAKRAEIFKLFNSLNLFRIAYEDLAGKKAYNLDKYIK